MPSFQIVGFALLGLTVVGCQRQLTATTLDSALKTDKAILSAIQLESPVATAQLAQFIESRKADKNPNVQDLVAHSRIKKGYAFAARNDYRAAREVFLEAEKSYKGTGKKDLEYGSIPDQAAYQAAVCLMAAKDKPGAIAAFSQFIEERSSSPLIHGAHRRLKMLDPQRTEAWDALLETAVNKRDAQMRIDMASCGPQIISILAQHIGNDGSDVPGSGDLPLRERLATYCRTTSEGTSLADMVRGLKRIGIDGTGMELNAPDFMRRPIPMIWLTQSHFLLVVHREQDSVIVFDPLLNNYREIPGPKPPDLRFRAKVITLRPTNIYSAFRPFDLDSIPQAN